ncbi:hypothetical protein FSP39_016966 [Pinctada imbricata]|uniref:Uncharacterized protein n=1 Tax=Pinctada imbricata TaxID=66713 RepID=A0AA89C1R2_PINIB|nr:hypothetical protein FSP39_016966 [Pinctada imbricata]
MLRLSVGILLVSLSVLCGGAHAQCTPCPSACTCTHIAGTADDCTVNCTNGNIEWIPTSSELPTANDIRIFDLSDNPWDCTCSFKTFRDTLVTLESNGLTLVNRGQVPVRTVLVTRMKRLIPNTLCSTSRATLPQTSLTAPKPASIRIWPMQFSITLCVCVATTPVLQMSVCAIAKPYTPGDNIQCSLTSGGTQTKTFLQGVYRVESGLTLDTISGVTAGSSYTFIASVVLRTITKFKWSFGDSSSIEERITSSTSYNMPHTYPLPGVYDLTVGIESTSGGTDNGTIKVHVDPATSSVDPVLTCPSYINYESSLTGVTVSYGMANALEYSWTRSPDDNVTSTVGGDCDSGWTVFNGRCIQFKSTTENYADATTTCGSDATLLTIHYPNELTSIVSSYSLSGLLGYKLLGMETVFTIDITTSTLHGLSCATSANFICQKKPIECPHGGTAYGTSNMCYVLQSTSSAWTAAQTSCQSLVRLRTACQSELGSHTKSCHQYLGATTEVWVGLTDRSLEGYMEWADYTSKGTYPSVSAETKDCYSLSSSGTWTARKCSTTLPYVCQYSVIRGMWINGGGRLRAWNFITAPRTSDVKLVFQVYIPSCPGGQTFIKPGCDGNGAQFGSCVASGSCSAASSCGNNEEYCYISQSCQPKGDPCNCVGRSDTFCNTLYKDSSPTYTLMGQTFLDLPAGGSEFYTVNADNIDVSENYVIAFQTNSGSDIIQCDTNTGSTWAQSALQVLKTGWMSIGDSVTAGTLWKNNTACYFQAIVAGTETESLPASLQYFSKPDTYTYTVSAPSLSIAKSCDVKAEEQIGDIEWIHPVVQSTSGSSDTIYVQHDQATYLVFAVTRGSHLTTEFNFGSSNVTGTFQAACPSTIESAFPSECNATNRWPDLPFAYEIQTFNFTSASSVSLTLKVKNDVSTDKTKSITILVFMPIIGLNIDLSVPNSRNIVEMGTSTQFTVTKTSGNPTSYRYMVNGTVSRSGSGCDAITGNTSNKVTMTSSSLSVGETYTVQLTVSITSRTSSTVSKEILISSDDVPQVSIECVSCQANTNYVLSQGVLVMLRGFCSNCGTATLTYRWTAKYGSTSLTLDSTTSSTLDDKINLVIDEDQLPDCNNIQLQARGGENRHKRYSDGVLRNRYDGKYTALWWIMQFEPYDSEVTGGQSNVYLYWLLRL